MIYQLSQTDIEKRLGRSLSDGEVANLDSLIAVAKGRLEQALNGSVDGSGARMFMSNAPFRQLFTGPFTTVNKLTVDGTEVAQGDYTTMLTDSFGDWSNSVMFSVPMCTNQIIQIDADWGFGETLPDELVQLWTLLFDVASRTTLEARDDNGRLISDITSEKIIDYSVNYRSPSTDEFTAILQSNQAIIDKYATPDNIVAPAGIGRCLR